jgi:ATP/ADP translocase
MSKLYLYLSVFVRFQNLFNCLILLKHSSSNKDAFWRENVFKIVPVQVPTKLEMWQNCVAFIFVITYVLQAMWPHVVYILIGRFSLCGSRVFARLHHRAGGGASVVSIRAPA